MYCKYCGRLIDDDSIFCRHCGKRVANTIETTDSSDKEKNTEVPEVADSHEPADAPEAADSQPIDDLPLNPRTRNILKNIGLNTLSDVQDYGLEKLRVLPGFGKRGYYDIERLLRTNPLKLPAVMDAKTHEYIQLQYKEYVYDRAEINVMKEKDGRKFVERRKPLFVRVRNLCKGWDKFEDMLEAVASGNIKIPKTYYDMDSVIMKELKDFVNYTFLPFVEKALAMNKREVRDGILKIKFPFLGEYQREFVLEFEDKHGYLPIFYIIYCFVCQGRERYNLILSLKVGFGQKPRTTDEVKKLVRLDSDERVRQIVAKGIDFGYPYSDRRKDEKYIYPQRMWFEELVAKNAPHYVNLFSQQELTPESTAYLTTITQEHLGDNFEAFTMTMKAIKQLAENTLAASFLAPAVSPPQALNSNPL